MSDMTEQDRLASLFTTEEATTTPTIDGETTGDSSVVDFQGDEQARLAALMDQEDQQPVHEGGVGLPDTTTVTDAEGNEVQIQSDVMTAADPSLDIGRKTRIAAGSFLQSAAETLEFPFKVVAGAVDEVTAMLGRDTSKSGAYPLQNIVDSIIRFDETANMLVPKKDRVPITAADFGIQALAGGLGAGIPISGGMLAQGQKTLTAGTSALTTGQQASIASGVTPRTATDILSKTTPTATLAQRAAANPAVVGATDLGFSAAGGLGAATGAAITPDQTPEGRASAAAVGELAGIGTAFASPVIKTVATKGPIGTIARWSWKKSEPVRELAVELFNRESFSEMTLGQKLKPSNWKAMIDEKAIERYGRKDVLEHMHKFLRTNEVKTRVSDRIRAVNSLNERLAAAGIDAQYQPGFGALVGTEESVAFQQMTDYHNYEYALTMEYNNNKALTEARKLFAKDPSFKYSNDMAELFEMMSKDTESMLTTMQSKMDDVASSMIEQTFANAGTPTKEGEILRKHYGNMQDVYNKLRDDMYAMIEVPTNIKFKTDKLSVRIEELLQPDRADSVVGSRVPILENILPKALKAAGEKGMDYDTLDTFRKRVGSEYRTLRADQPHSPYLETLAEIQHGIDDIIEKGIEQLPEEFNHIKVARASARRFFKEELAPRFRQGVLNDVNSVNVDGSMKISDDNIMAQFWERGDKTQGARDFKRLFMNFDNVDNQYFDADSLAYLGDEAKDAQESLFRYSLNTLQTDLQQAGKAGMTDPTKVLERWRNKYRGALSEFPDVAERTKTLDGVFEAISEQAQQYKKQRDYLSSNVIVKYLRTDPAVVTKRFLSGRREAQSTLDLIDSIYGSQPQKIQEIRDALEVSVMNSVLNSSVDKVTGKFKYDRIATIMEDASDTLPLILGQSEMKKLVEFNKSLSIIADQPRLLQQADLNDFKKALESAGISPASILSRYYSASLGKVGPVYLGTDAFTRYMTKKAEVYFKDLYKELMYNPQIIDDLEDLLVNVSQKAGDPKYLAPAQQKFKAQSVFSTLGVRIYGNDIFDDKADREEALKSDDQESEPVWEFDRETGTLSKGE